MTPEISAPEGAAKEITLWFRQDEKGAFQFNHLEDGHSEGDKPTPKVREQAAMWQRGIWLREHAWLDSSVPPKVLHDPEQQTAREVEARLRESPGSTPWSCRTR